VVAPQFSPDQAPLVLQVSGAPRLTRLARCLLRLLTSFWLFVTLRLLMQEKKVSTTVYITPEQNQLLKSLHSRTKVPVAEYIRQGIDIILEKHKTHLPGQLDLYSQKKS
jgi:hypothetical protein